MTKYSRRTSHKEIVLQKNSRLARFADMTFKSRRIFAMQLLFVIISCLVMSFGEKVLCAGELPGAHGTTSSSHEHDMSQIHESDCPSAPSPSHSPSDHFCAGDCGCPCQAPLSSSALIFTYSRPFSYLYPTEITSHIPEVYFSLLVPPDSTAV